MPMSANIFGNVVLEDFEVEALLNELNNDDAQQVCGYCGCSVSDSDYECPNCGVLLRTAPKRKTEAQRTLVHTIDSANMNGTYNIYSLPDGNLYCNCLSFLFQRGVKERDGKVVCKHIKEYLETSGETLNATFQPLTQPLTAWQRILLKKLGIASHEKLSKEQAYWIISEMLAKIGIEYKDFIKLARENPTYELLPLYSFGVELEGLIRDRENMYNKMRELGFKVKLTGYSHEMGNKLWKVGDDGSVRRSMNDEEQRQFQSMELTSPKLFGDEGFNDIRKVLKIWNEIGGNVNNSCGFHVHIDAWGYNKRDLKRLLLVWAKIEPIVYFFVSPSRRNNRYAHFWRRKQDALSYTLRTADPPDRYVSLNLSAYKQYKTVEFRIHQGTMNPEKVIYWVVFCLKVIQKVKEGLKWYHFSENPSVEEVLDKLGIVNNAIPIIKKTREYLIERYNHFSNDNSCDLPELSIENIKSEARRYIIAKYSERNFLYAQHQPTRPINYVENLAIKNPRNLIPWSEIVQTRENETTYRIRSLSDSNRNVYTVTYNNSNDTLSCTCRGFRQHNYCVHTISIARFLRTEKELELAETLDY